MRAFLVNAAIVAGLSISGAILAHFMFGAGFGWCGAWGALTGWSLASDMTS